MKKIVLMAAVALSMCVVSCKKDYKCSCTKTATNGSTTVTVSDGDYTFKDTRTRAESRCNDQESANNGTTRDCQIK